MVVQFDFTFQLIGYITGFIAWCAIGMLAYRFYKKQPDKPKIWKVILCMLVGLFSFSFNWRVFDTPVKFAILPLGVWILYFLLKAKDGRWERYRKFVWLGFLANYIFLAGTLLALPLQHIIYPENKLSTYIGDFENARIINTHPSALERSLDLEVLQKHVHSMAAKSVHGQQWYYDDDVAREDSTDRHERFPYVLTGISTKWGSGLETMIYLEADGKGMLVTTGKRQLYFRSKVSLLKGDK
ncbi:hypothetical protein FAY30_01280 [Bacillus sp. S3]|uniref:hypothetical protein n=1 Tax=Bacillus sp. S3 TaxID=486398 RepID=UPI001187E42A|nr:hypothetical protein [Bacillus sp. S3]QCJ40657.1 hypothetical protein FAY30_01280 [Bacillus sp. S3]